MFRLSWPLPDAGPAAANAAPAESPHRADVPEMFRRCGQRRRDRLYRT